MVITCDEITTSIMIRHILKNEAYKGAEKWVGLYIEGGSVD